MISKETNYIYLFTNLIITILLVIARLDTIIATIPLSLTILIGLVIWVFVRSIEYILHDCENNKNKGLGDFTFSVCAVSFAIQCGLMVEEIAIYYLLNIFVTLLIVPFTLYWCLQISYVVCKWNECKKLKRCEIELARAKEKINALDYPEI